MIHGPLDVCPAGIKDNFMQQTDPRMEQGKVILF